MASWLLFLSSATATLSYTRIRPRRRALRCGGCGELGNRCIPCAPQKVIAGVCVCVPVFANCTTHNPAYPASVRAQDRSRNAINGTNKQSAANGNTSDAFQSGMAGVAACRTVRLLAEFRSIGRRIVPFWQASRVRIRAVVVTAFSALLAAHGRPARPSRPARA